MSTDLEVTIPGRLAGAQLDAALAELVEGCSRAQIQKLVRRGHVRLRGRAVRRSNVKVNGGDRIELRLESRPGAKPDELAVLHEDADLIVIDKPPGLLCHPTQRLDGDTLSGRLAERFGALPILKGSERPGIVHRLDRETSGVIAVARTDRSMLSLEDQFRQRTTQKTYWALVHGHADPGEGEVAGALSPHPRDRDRQCLDPRGKPARTGYQELERLRGGALIECYPQTGRRHQIRVHLESIGCPIVGDRMYGARGLSVPDGVPRVKRHALHAHRLELAHPATGERVTFESPWPVDLEPTLTAWRQLHR